MIFDEGAREDVRAMLRAWSAEGPSEEARAKTLAALGVAATGAAAAGLAAGAGKTASIAPKAAGLGVGTLLKWLAVGVAAVATTAGAAVVVTRASAPRVAVSAPVPIATNVTSAASAFATTATTAAPAVTASASPTTDLPSAPPLAAPPVASAPKPTLADEVALVDRARSALASGDFGGALRAVSEYESRFPRGAFTQEAEIVRIDALARSGQRAAATRAAKRFVAIYPSSAHAARMRALAADAQ
jgi:hypothetical protein